jgi:hypothetical protein
LQAIHVLMGEARTALVSLIGSSFVDGDCKRWRWSNTSGITAALPSTTLRNEKETWLAWHTAMRAALALMVQVVSDAWTSVQWRFLVEVESSACEGERRMVEPGALGASTTDFIYSLLSDKVYSNFGDCVGDSFSLPIGPFIGTTARGQYAGQVALGGVEAFAYCDAGYGCVFPPVDGETGNDFYDFNAAKKTDANRNGFIVKESSPGVYFIPIDDSSVFFDPDDIGWFVIQKTHKEFKVTVTNNPATTTIHWAVGLQAARGARTSGGFTMSQASVDVTKSSDSFSSSLGDKFISYDVELDDMPIDNADYPGAWGDPEGTVGSIGFSINGINASVLSNGPDGTVYKVDACLDACGNIRSPI